MPKHTAKIVDETSLYDGMKNLATSYYDTLSEFNHKKGEHFSFQSLKDLDWKSAVSKLIGGETIGQMTEAGSSVLKSGAKALSEGLLSVVGGEVGATAFAVGQLTDLIIDTAVDRFTKEDVQEVYQQGKWIYDNKLIRSTEMAAETSMFQDKTKLGACFHPGFT